MCKAVDAETFDSLASNKLTASTAATTTNNNNSNKSKSTSPSSPTSSTPSSLHTTQFLALPQNASVLLIDRTASGWALGRLVDSETRVVSSSSGWFPISFLYSPPPPSTIQITAMMQQPFHPLSQSLIAPHHQQQQPHANFASHTPHLLLNVPPHAVDFPPLNNSDFSAVPTDNSTRKMSLAQPSWMMNPPPTAAPFLPPASSDLYPPTSLNMHLSTNNSSANNNSQMLNASLTSNMMPPAASPRFVMYPLGHQGQQQQSILYQSHTSAAPNANQTAIPPHLQQQQQNMQAAPNAAATSTNISHNASLLQQKQTQQHLHMQQQQQQQQQRMLLPNANSDSSLLMMNRGRSQTTLAGPNPAMGGHPLVFSNTNSQMLNSRISASPSTAASNSAAAANSNNGPLSRRPSSSQQPSAAQSSGQQIQPGASPSVRRSSTGNEAGNSRNMPSSPVSRTQSTSNVPGGVGLSSRFSSPLPSSSATNNVSRNGVGSRPPSPMTNRGALFTNGSSNNIAANWMNNNPSAVSSKGPNRPPSPAGRDFVAFNRSALSSASSGAGVNADFYNNAGSASKRAGGASHLSKQRAPSPMLRHKSSNGTVSTSNQPSSYPNSSGSMANAPKPTWKF
eukprot:GDKK01050363.1.p1 GENE.GDKK01050363.1~~GDKK01050363.1.p1  ORF type:complete len:655 (-),score=252.92 GDKK01050363.1:651-2513(-)